MLKCLLDVNPQTRYKIDQIRESKWYNLSNKKYIANGIIVGKDTIEINDKVARIIQKQGVSLGQIKTYILNNRHNHVTTFYYLLLKKAEKYPNILEDAKEI